MSLRFPLRPLAGLLAALTLAGCGGGGGAASSAGGATPAAPGITMGTLAPITSPNGAPAITHMVDGLVLGDHAVLRSDSADASDPTHPGTRFTIVDPQGRASASIDYGYTLVPGYNGDWHMLALPSGAGFALVQKTAGSRLFLFDAQARLTGPAGGVNLYQPSTAPDGPTVYASSAAVDGNGFWIATSFKYPQANGGAIYRVTLTKFDFNGKALTPTNTMATSNKSQGPRIAAAGGALSLFWTDGTQPSLFYWAAGGGGPVQKGINAVISRVALQPVALSANGKLGLLWGGGGSTAGTLNGIQLSASGEPLLPAGANDWTGQVLSSKWVGTRRGIQPGADLSNGRLMITDVVDDPANPGDTIVLADYTVNDGPLAAVTPVIATQHRPGTRTIDNGAAMRQLVFSDHTLLLIGDADHLECAVVTRH